MGADKILATRTELIEITVELLETWLSVRAQVAEVLEGWP